MEKMTPQKLRVLLDPIHEELALGMSGWRRREETIIGDMVLAFVENLKGILGPDLDAAADAWRADLDKIAELDAALRIVTVAADKVVGA